MGFSTETPESKLKGDQNVELIWIQTKQKLYKENAAEMVGNAPM